MMKKPLGREILWVLLFCFVSISVFGFSGNEKWNNLPLLLSKSIESSNLFIPEIFIGNSPIQSHHSPVLYLSGGPATFPYANQNGPKHADIVQVRILRKSFFLNFAFSGKVQLQSQNITSPISLPLIGLALGYFILDLNTSITQSV